MAAPQPAPSDGSPSSELDELVFDCLERMEREGPQVLEEVCAAHPAQAAALVERLRGLQANGLLWAEGGSEPGFPERLGDFHLLRRLGQGGMGVVFLARQESLGREVALKLIRPEQLYFPGARARFRREVEAVARLAHPGIVPVHAVGEAEGIPYLAMERVHGASLEELLDNLRGRARESLRGRDLLEGVARRTGAEPPLELPRAFMGGWSEACLWIARELAQALEHAHQRGVLHRDVKPSNVMLTADGRVLLVDFGLARAEGASRLTRSGVQTGSLPYMAPEQVRGEADGVDARTDVYGVGVTLYELLALAPPYGGASNAELSRAILAAQPARLGTRGASGDVETVVATAMAPERERRYAGAADLARDLTNLLERRPILARPASAAVRLLRWSQRHPARATATALGLVIAIGGPSLYGWQAQRAAKRRFELIGQLEVQRDEAREQRAAAERNLATALDAVDSMLARVGDSRLANVPQVSRVRQELLEEALAYYEGFLAAHPDDPRLRADRLRTRLRQARLLRLLGRSEEARTTYAAVLEGLRAEAAAERLPEHDALLAEGGNGLAGILADTGRIAEAEVVCRDTLAALALPPLESEQARPLRILQAEMLTATGRLAEAERAFAELREALAALAAARPDDVGLRRDLARANLSLGDLRLSAGGGADALEFLAEALALLEPLARATPDHVGLTADLARTHSQLAVASVDVSAELAEQHALAACDLLEPLSAGFSDWPGLMLDLSGALANLAAARAERGDSAGALPLVERGTEVLTRLVEVHPDVSRYRATLARMESNLFATLFELGRIEEALPHLERAQAQAERCLETQAAHPDLVEMRVVLCVNRGYALLGLGRYREAVEAVTPLPDWPRAREPLSAAVVCMRALDQLALDESVAPDEAAELEARFTGRALELLERGVDAGFDDAEDLRATGPWEPLRGLPEFEALVERVAARAAESP